MSKWHELAHFLYGKGFWYADPLKEIDGLSGEQLFWTPHPKSFCILWHLGHIAHRERVHIGKFLQGVKVPVIPPQFEVFGVDWVPVEEIRKSINSVGDVFTWVREVRTRTHEYINSLTSSDFHTVPPTSDGGHSIAHWLFITVAHTALHIGCIQHLRALVEGRHDRAC